MPLAAVPVLSTKGEVIGVSRDMAERLRAGGHDFGPGGARVAKPRCLCPSTAPREGAVPTPFWMHAELLHEVLGGLGLQAPAALDVRTVPPPVMALVAADLDAFCNGKPRGAMAVEDAEAELLRPGSAIWPGTPGKVLRDPDSRPVACGIPASRGHLDVPAEVIERALSGHLTISARGEHRVTRGFIGFSRVPSEAGRANRIGGPLAAYPELDRAAAQTAARASFRSDNHRHALGGVPGHWTRRPGWIVSSMTGY